MHTLYLTAKEKKIFGRIPVELTKGQETADETQTYEDTPQRRSIRMKQLSMKDQSLQKFIETTALASSEKEFQTMLGSLDLRSISDDDLQEVLFAVGPDAIGFMISGALENAKDVETIELAVALSLLRHQMLESLAAPII